jgi:hypothetical protein
MKSSTSLKEGDEVLFFGVDSNVRADLIYGTVEAITYTGGVKRPDRKRFYVEEVGGKRSLSTDNPYNLMKLKSIMKSHEIRYIR